MVFHVYRKIQLVSDIWTEFTVTVYAAMLARLTLVPTEQTYLIRTLIMITFSIRVQLKISVFLTQNERVKMNLTLKTARFRLGLLISDAVAINTNNLYQDLRSGFKRLHSCDRKLVTNFNFNMKNVLMLTR